MEFKKIVLLAGLPGCSARHKVAEMLMKMAVLRTEEMKMSSAFKRIAKSDVQRWRGMLPAIERGMYLSDESVLSLIEEELILITQRKQAVIIANNVVKTAKQHEGFKRIARCYGYSLETILIDSTREKSEEYFRAEGDDAAVNIRRLDQYTEHTAPWIESLLQSEEEHLVIDGHQKVLAITKKIIAYFFRMNKFCAEEVGGCIATPCSEEEIEAAFRRPFTLSRGIPATA